MTGPPPIVVLDTGLRRRLSRRLEEMSSVMLAEADAEMQFQRRAQRGAEKDARGPTLLERAVGHGRSGGPPAES